MRKFILAGAALFLSGCFHGLIEKQPVNRGLLVADGLKDEPAFDVEYEPGTGRSIFAWTSVTGSTSSAVHISAVDETGRELWKASPVAAETRGPLQFEARVAVSSSNVFASWDEYLLGSFSLNAAVLDPDGVQLPMKARVYGISKVNRDKNVMIAAEGDSAALAWEDYDPAVKTTYVGVAEIGASGLRWTRILGDKNENERYLDPVLAPSGAGGVLAAFRHLHNGDKGIVVRRFNADGASWPDDVQASDAISYKANPQLADDGLGGAFVVWEDGRNGSTDLYAQHISSSGAVLWDTGGIPVAESDGNSWNPVVVPDGGGSFYCAWIDDNMGSRWELKVQRMDRDGTPLWGAEGLTVCKSDNKQSMPSIVSDGDGGCVAVWNEARDGTLNIFAQRFDPDGVMLWDEAGVPVVSPGADHILPQIAADQNGGFVVGWKQRVHARKWQIKAQRLDEEGAPLWK
jgi:hypothetical protein